MDFQNIGMAEQGTLERGKSSLLRPPFRDLDPQSGRRPMNHECPAICLHLQAANHESREAIRWLTYPEHAKA
jgi:hypothetical protein